MSYEPDSKVVSDNKIHSHPFLPFKEGGKDGNRGREEGLRLMKVFAKGHLL
jgi:hypothetical protein